MRNLRPTRSPARLVAALVLVTAALLWLRVNGPVEGPVLLVVTPNHGLTVADLASLAALALAVPLLLTRRR